MKQKFNRQKIETNGWTICDRLTDGNIWLMHPHAPNLRLNLINFSIESKVEDHKLVSGFLSSAMLQYVQSLYTKAELALQTAEELMTSFSGFNARWFLNGDQCFLNKKKLEFEFEKRFRLKFFEHECRIYQLRNYNEKIDMGVIAYVFRDVYSESEFQVVAKHDDQLAVNEIVY